MRRRFMALSGMEEDEVKEWELIGKIVSDGNGDTAGLTIPIDFTKYREIFIDANNCAASSTRRIVIRNQLAWYNGQTLYLGSAANISRIICVILNIGGELYPFSAYNTGYSGIDSKLCLQASPRNVLRQENYTMISLDTSNDGAIPEGETLTIYGR